MRKLGTRLGAAGEERWRRPSAPLRVGISRCLLGEEVRYDGRHKRDVFLVEVLGPFVEWVPVCPEVELGLGVPREAMRLERAAGRAAGAVSLVTIQTRRDLTAPMRRFSERRVRALAAVGLCGYVFKKSSPSCGLQDVKVFASDAPDERPDLDGRGLFAQALLRRFPRLPVEEEDRLADAALREDFIERLLAFRRLRALFDARWTLGDLVAFHAAHKLTLLARSTEGYRALGRLVGESKRRPRGELRTDYEAAFLDTLARPSTPGRHTNVLQHAAGHLKAVLSPAARAQLADAIAAYRRGRLSRKVPLGLLQNHARVHGVAYLAEQVYLESRPWQLMPAAE